MVKFLSGSTYSGESIPVCTYWRGDVKTDTDSDISPLEKGGGSEQCIANHYFTRASISCFNDGDCNGEGKCIVCTKYIYGGTRLGISHSPPTDILRFFNKGLTDADIRSPNLVRFPPSVVQQVDHTQMPLHILIRNVQAEIAKCCHWSLGTGTPSRFFLAVVQNGPDTITVTQANGQETQIKGIRVKNDAFDDDEGVFFAVGITVVAGFEEAPSFYLEPRTGLIKPGEDVIFSFNTSVGDQSAATNQAKSAASTTTQVVIDAVRTVALACQSARQRMSQSSSFLNNAFNTKNNAQIEAANAKVVELNAAQVAACEAAEEAAPKGQEAIDKINVVLGATTKEDTIQAVESLLPVLEELEALLVTGAINAGDTAARSTSQAIQTRLATQIRTLKYAGLGAFTKCDFFTTNENIAVQWNAPEDGSVPCNGVRTDCDFYTGKDWKFATEEKTGPGQVVLAEAIQEMRFRSDDWSRFSDPGGEFRNRFALPFLWAFKQYVPISGQPEVKDMLLYRPKTIYGRDTGQDSWETVEVQRIAVTSFGADDDFEVSKSSSRIQPGSEDIDQESSVQFPTLVDKFTVPSNVRLRVTHPQSDDRPFIYRTWSPDKNKITLMGTATPNSVIRIVNNTALLNRSRYHTEFGTTNFVEIPTVIPGLPDFNNITATQLEEQLFIPLRQERNSNVNQRAVSPLGFHEVGTAQDGFWSSIAEVELVHNTINDIYVILVAEEKRILFEKIQIDYRFLHSIVTQHAFDAIDFTINDTLSSAGTGILSGDLAQRAEITATTETLVRSLETPQFAFGYYGLRFKDRNLRFSTLFADNDLASSNPLLEATGNLLVTEAGPSTFINRVGYHVVRYRKEIEVDDWYVVNDCGFIMLVFSDTELHRVLPLPNQQGENPPLRDVLVNSGGKGSVVAQWAIEELTITVEGFTQPKPLVQFFRDVDGLGLPANYVLVGPDSDVVNAFGRPEFGRDTIKATVTFLRPQSTRSAILGSPGTGNQTLPELTEDVDVLDTNFHDDNLIRYRHTISFQDNGNLKAGGVRSFPESPDEAPISADAQEYCFVFADSTGRPLGRKYTRFLLSYYNIACLNVEIFYAWSTDCETAALVPDLFLAIGSASGQTSNSVSATTDPNDPRLILGERVKNSLGTRDCRTIASCGDHEFLALGGILREFEVIANVPAGGCGTDGTFSNDEGPALMQKAFYPSAGQAVAGEIVSARRPGDLFLKRRGPMWYPYIACERPRYEFSTGGPLNTDSTELINGEGTPPGVTGASFSVTEAAASPGCFGGLTEKSDEAYRGPDRITPKILDIHPSFRPCTSAFTYANQILRGGEARFSGYARIRGEVDLFWYQSTPGWEPPKFSNIARPKIMSEVTTKRGDYLGGPGGRDLGFRWMPMFPEREDLGASIELFGEEMETQAYRLLCVSTPVGAVGEQVSATPERFTQKALIHNRVGGAIEYPFVPYYPSFLPDSSLGNEPSARTADGLEGESVSSITTMWAWREQETFIKRGQQSSSVLPGLELALPPYFIDNRRMEIRIRPEESTYAINWKAPTYEEDGSLKTPAELKFGLDGPPREITIDFKNRIFQVNTQQDTVYDTTQGIDSPAFPCNAGTKTDNLRINATCACVEDITDPSLDNQNFPSRVLHLDELSPDGFFALYENDVLNTPFAIDVPQDTEDASRPCCMCIHYIRGIFFRLNPEFIPSVFITDASFDSRTPFTYTWSRVPHGFTTGLGVDDVWAAVENRADNFIDAVEGSIFQNRFNDNVTSIDITNDDPAVFPSRLHAVEQIQNGDPILVLDLAAGDEKLKGGQAAVNGESQGQTEQIVLTVDFETYVKISKVDISFITGKGWEAPKYQLIRVEPNNIGQGAFPAAERGQSLGVSPLSAVESSIPGSEDDDADDINDGRLRFISSLTPSYTNQPIWNQYGKRFQLVFSRRGNAQNMGIASIQFQMNAITDGFTNTELIFVPERKYYRSSGSVPGNKNPEQVLGAQDSATAYWSVIGSSAEQGANRHRAYSWGERVDDASSRPILSSDVSGLEELQAQEYNKARTLMSVPYVFRYTSFIPLDEAKWLRFLNLPDPSWNCSVSVFPSSLDKLIDLSGNDVFGKIPERSVFNPPGHAWTWTLSNEKYVLCCIDCPPQQIIDYQFIHLHDSLTVIDTARFWDELPSGFTRLIRSTLMSPDPTFGSQPSAGSPVIVNVTDFTDANGNPIDLSVLESAGFTRNEDGSLAIIDRGSM